MVKIKTTKTKHKGVLQVIGRANAYRVRGSVKNQKTGKTVDLDNVVTATSPLDASRKRAALLAALESAMPQQAERKRLRDYATWWLATKLPSLKPSTRSLYATVLDEHILPELGDYWLDTIERDDLLDWRARMLEKPTLTPQGKPRTDKAGNHILPSATSVNGRMRVLKTVLLDAVESGHIPRDPTRRIPALTEKKAWSSDEEESDEEEEAGRSITADELSALLKAIKELRPDWYPFFYVLAFTGMRFGEVSALKWADIDRANGKLWVRRAQWKGQFGLPKNGKKRSVPLTAEMLAVLDAHRVSQREKLVRRLKRQRVPDIKLSKADTVWMFPAPRAHGKFLHSSSPRKPLHAAMASVGIEDFTVHGFRHTFNNLVRQAAGMQGQNLVLQAMTGHSSDEMTEHYSQVSIEEKRKAVGGLLRLVRVE